MNEMDDPTLEDLNPEELDGLAEVLLAHDPEDDGYDAAQRVFPTGAPSLSVALLSMARSNIAASLKSAS